MAKLRTRKHRVVLNRSVGGDTGITIILSLMGIFMFLPMWYLIVNAFKPLGERNITPALLCYEADTAELYRPFHQHNMTWVPISRYIFNTIIISILATLGCLILGSLTAYALSDSFPAQTSSLRLSATR